MGTHNPSDIGTRLAGTDDASMKAPATQLTKEENEMKTALKELAALIIVTGVSIALVIGLMAMFHAAIFIG